MLPARRADRDNRLITRVVAFNPRCPRPAAGARPPRHSMSGIARGTLALLACASLVLSLGASHGRAAAPSGPVTISLLTTIVDEPAYSVLIPNFERVYPNITVEVTYSSGSGLQQLEATELAAGSAPALLDTAPGCGAPNAICDYAAAGELAPLVHAPWVRRSLPSVTSSLKHGAGLFGFQPVLSPFGVFTNDTLFGRLGLRVPETFAQLLTLCRRAQADDTPAVILPGGSPPSSAYLAYGLATASLYGHDRRWNSELKAGTASFDGTAGWHQALQEVIDMNDAGCFEPGVAGESGAAATTLFAGGGGLMEATNSTTQGTIAADDPSFAYSFHPFPSGTSADGTNTFINVNDALSINAHSSAESQAAAQTFIDFLARPKQDALFAQTTGGLTQYQFLKHQLPSFMSSFEPALERDAYVLKPSLTWWNADVSLTLQTDAIGLVTGQTTVDSILQAMDAAWQKGPS